MTTTQIGRKAEAAARAYLEMRGFKIIEQNFRRPNCEIDIVAKKDRTVHFIEVRYRKNDEQGGGFDSITASKLKKMRHAAWTWADEYKWRGEYVLSAIELGGSKFAVMGFIENVF
jgi:uncharacterized protein (TIGR00252 family)